MFYKIFVPLFTKYLSMVVMNVITYSIEYQAVVLSGKKSFFLIVYLCISRYYVAEWECFED